MKKDPFHRCCFYQVFLYYANKKFRDSFDPNEKLASVKNAEGLFCCVVLSIPLCYLAKERTNVFRL